MRVAGEMLSTGYLNSCAKSWMAYWSLDRIVIPDGAIISKAHVFGWAIPGAANLTSLNKTGGEVFEACCVFLSQ